MNQYIIAICLCAGLTLHVGASPVTGSGLAKPRPNFVVIFTDDQGYADLGCFGGKHVSTPRIDQMAAQGARLTSFYMAASLCSPSRAALLTGCYPKRLDMAEGDGFPVLLAADRKGMHPNEVTIAEVLKSVGYKTGIFGKWHLGDQPQFLPTRQGFDEFFGIPYSHDIHPFHSQQKKYQFPPLPLLDGEKVIELDPDADYLTRRITGRAVRFIQANKDQPFFLYIPHPIPHRPLYASPPFMESAPDAVKARLAKEGRGVDYKTRDKIYRQVISEIDWSVGEILDALKKAGVDDNTLVIFTSDNGPRIGKSIPLSGKKGSVYEGGMRVPTVVRWPEHITEGLVSDELMTAMDLLPTFAKLAGAKLPADRVLDGKDVGAVLMGDAKTPHEAFYYHKGNKLKAVRSGKWKLHITDKSSPALYDLEGDVGEKNNVLADHPLVVDRLRSDAEAFTEELGQNSRTAAFVENPKALTIATSIVPGEMKTIHISRSELTGIGVEEGVMRRDPSDVIKVGDLYYVWYSKGKISSGYDATVWYATSPDGRAWTEKGMALGKGRSGSWDGASVFTPNILLAEGRYWLFYTGTSKKYRKGFSPDSKIGMAVSDSPDGPWKRLGTDPVLMNSDNPDDFDSHLVDDACLIKRDGKYWFYYKGRQQGKSPAFTKLGLAIAEKPGGPYVKVKSNPIISGNHEVLVWPQGKGVAAMIGNVGPKEITSSILYAEDGLHFSKTYGIRNVPHAAGAYRPDAYTDSGTGTLNSNCRIAAWRARKSDLPIDPPQGLHCRQ